jgi:hypothetical protein
VCKDSIKVDFRLAFFGPGCFKSLLNPAGFPCHLRLASSLVYCGFVAAFSSATAQDFVFTKIVLILSNDNWRDSQEQEIMDTGIPPTNDFESAIVRGKNDTTGNALVEAYELP